MKYQIDQKIVTGQHYREFQFQKFNEDFVGLFKKVGQKVTVNESNRDILCEDCFLSSSKSEELISYQVPGVTDNRNFYDWNETRYLEMKCYVVIYLPYLQ